MPDRWIFESFFFLEKVKDVFFNVNYSGEGDLLEESDSMKQQRGAYNLFVLNRIFPRNDRNVHSNRKHE